MLRAQVPVHKVLISACLLGKRVRYDGKTLTVAQEILQAWLHEGRVVSVCPEVDAGMSIPRPPAEIVSGDGSEVLAGSSSVLANTGADVSHYFLKGANLALDLCKEHKILIAILTEGSPSCGSSLIHDGTFSAAKKAGEGVTTALLRQNGIAVFNQHQLTEASDALRQL